MKYLFTFLWIFSSYQYAGACGNTYYHVTKLDGENVESEISYYYNVHPLTSRFNIRKLNEKRKQDEFALRRDPYNYKLLSDHALLLLKLGETDSSLIILRKLYRSYPEEYNILANLGTAYELAGKPDSALLILTKAVGLNPESHKGSEWIHLKVLEAKLARQKDQKYNLADHSIIGLKIKDVKKYYDYFRKQPKAYQDSIIAIKNQLHWQLDERTGFVEPSDVYVANLLLDLANLEAVTGSIESALPFYELALVYDPFDDLGIRKIYGKLLPLSKKLVAKEDTGMLNNFMNILTGFSIIFLPIMFFIVILVIKKKKTTRHAK